MLPCDCKRLRSTWTIGHRKNAERTKKALWMTDVGPHGVRRENLIGIKRQFTAHKKYLLVTL